MNKYFLLLVSLCLLSCTHPESNRNRNFGKRDSSSIFSESENLSTVIDIKDGDTYVILIEDKEVIVRLDHIDCPEKRQPFGMQAKKFASDLCFDKTVFLVSKNKFDRYNRLIAEVFLENGVCVNKELVANGLAWHYKKYSRSRAYSELEKEARAKKIGLWRELYPIPPWNWRKK